MAAPRLLLVEDDRSLAELVTFHFERAGYQVTRTGDGEEALILVDEVKPDAILLDWMIEGISGIEVCRRLRRRPTTANVPIMMLTARGSERDRVTGLELGADDYLTKPFSVRELVARVAAVWRRSRVATEDPMLYDDGELKIDERSFRVYRHGTEVKLAKKEFELLWMLVRNKSSVVSRERILSEVWHMSDDVETRTVDAHIRNLRKKIGSQRISTVVGFGYRYDPPSR